VADREATGAPDVADPLGDIRLDAEPLADTVEPHAHDRGAPGQGMAIDNGAPGVRSIPGPGAEDR